MMNAIYQRRYALFSRPGGPEVVHIVEEQIPPLGPGEVLVKVEVAGLNHIDTLIRQGNYPVQFPVPGGAGMEGAGVVVAVGPKVSWEPGARVCWTGVPGSVGTHVVARQPFLAPIPEGLTFEDAATVTHCGLTAAALTRVWPVAGERVLVWGAAGVVGRLLTALLSEMGAEVIGVASRGRVEGAYKAGASYVIDRTESDVSEELLKFTHGQKVAAVYDPIGAATLDVSLGVLAPRGCLISYGELSGALPVIDMRRLMAAGSVFATKFMAAHWIEGAEDMVTLIGHVLALAGERPVTGPVAGRFALDQAADAYRLLESQANGKVLVAPHA